MHARLRLRLVSQGASHRFAIHGHVLLLLLAVLPCQSARFVLAALGRFPARQATCHHREQLLRIDFAQRIQIRS